MTGTDTTADAADAADAEPIRFFGTTWLHHDRGYRRRRVALAAGSLAGAVAGVGLVALGVVGILAGTSGPAMPFLAVIGVTVCSAVAFHHTWTSFVRRPSTPDPEAARGLYAIGFVGVLLAYFVRSLIEAPGERLHRTEHESTPAPPPPEPTPTPDLSRPESP